MITKQEVYANGIKWLMAQYDMEKQTVYFEVKEKSIFQKIKEYIKEII